MYNLVVNHVVRARPFSSTFPVPHKITEVDMLGLSRGVGRIFTEGFLKRRAVCTCEQNIQSHTHFDHTFQLRALVTIY